MIGRKYSRLPFDGFPVVRISSIYIAVTEYFHWAAFRILLLLGGCTLQARTARVGIVLAHDVDGKRNVRFGIARVITQLIDNISASSDAPGT